MLTVFALAIALAQTPEPAKDAPVPSISLEHQVKFFKAQNKVLTTQLDLIQAQKANDDAKSAYQPVVQELVKDCGDTANLSLDKSGDTVCVAKPASAPDKK